MFLKVAVYFHFRARLQWISLASWWRISASSKILRLKACLSMRTILSGCFVSHNLNYSPARHILKLYNSRSRHHNSWKEISARESYYGSHSRNSIWHHHRRCCHHIMFTGNFQRFPKKYATEIAQQTKREMKALKNKARRKNYELNKKLRKESFTALSN